MAKKHADKIREAVTELVVASPREIMDWIKQHYPEDPVNPASYRADIIGCSVNHSSSKHYPSQPKFLWFDKETKKYRLVSPDEAATQVTEPEKRIEDEDEIIDGIPISKISITCQIRMPKKILNEMNLKPGDSLGWIINESGILELRKAKISIKLE